MASSAQRAQAEAAVELLGEPNITELDHHGLTAGTPATAHPPTDQLATVLVAVHVLQDEVKRLSNRHDTSAAEAERGRNDHATAVGAIHSEAAQLRQQCTQLASTVTATTAKLETRFEVTSAAIHRKFADRWRSGVRGGDKCAWK